jgi:SOS-response transcriptional repressor LexA
MTAGQRKMMDAVHDFWKANGHAPSLRELQEILGYKSVSQSHATLKALRDRGWLISSPNKARSLRLSSYGIRLYNGEAKRKEKWPNEML